MRLNRSGASFVLRLGLSLALLVFLGRRLGGGWQEIQDLDPWALLPAVGVFALSTVLGAWQWTLVLRHAGIGTPAPRLHALYWSGLFLNNFLPSNVGGDLLKVADLGARTGRYTRPIAGTLLDRMLGLFALVSLAFLAGAGLGAARPAGLPWWALVGLVLTVGGAAATLISGRLGRILVGLAERVGGRRREKLRGLVSELQAYRAAPGLVLRLILLALVVQSLRVGTHVLVARAMGMEMGLERVLQFYVLVPVLGVAVVLPVSFNGLGVRELVATRLMPAVGITAPTAFALQLTTYLVQVAVSLVGGLVFAGLLLRGRLRLRRGEPGPD